MGKPFSAESYKWLHCVRSAEVDLSGGASVDEPIYLNMHEPVVIQKISFICTETVAVAAGSIFVGDKDDADEFAGVADNIAVDVAADAIVDIPLIDPTIPRGTAIYISGDDSGQAGKGYVVIELGSASQNV